MLLCFQKRSLEATAHGNLGSTHRMMSKLDTAEAHHNQELSICQELEDVKSECKAHGHLGNVHLSAGMELSDICPFYSHELINNIIHVV